MGGWGGGEYVNMCAAARQSCGLACVSECTNVSQCVH